MRFLVTVALVLLGCTTVCEAVSSIGPAWPNQDAPIKPWWDTTTTPPSGNNGDCKSWWADSQSSAICCNDKTSSQYGTCKSSGVFNCPGEDTKETCNSGANNDPSGGPSCPHFAVVSFSQTLYPKCRLASTTCDPSAGQTSCWGTIACYESDVTPTSSDTPVDCGDYVFNVKNGITFHYHTGDFCYTDGNSDNTKWCSHAQCPQGQAVDPTDPTKCIPCPSPDFPNAQVDPHTGVCCLFGYNPVTQSCRTGGGGINQDPQFAGFQGQNFQFHGLADEVFNLVSTPSLQVNGHFVYLSSGKCDFNDTLCWSHPGTYVDQLGFSFGVRRLKLVAGSHHVGMHVSMDGEVLMKGNYHLDINGTTVTVKYKHHRKITIKTSEFAFTIYNSDMFFNLEAAMLDQRLLRLGSPKHTITDSTLCNKEASVDDTKFQTEQIAHTHNHGAVEAAIEKKYGGVQVPLHGLIGQTWRNVKVCGKHWVGQPTDYVCSDLFASDYFFNFFHRD